MNQELKMKKVEIAPSLEANQNQKQIVRATLFPSLRERRAKTVHPKLKAKEMTKKAVRVT